MSYIDYAIYSIKGEAICSAWIFIEKKTEANQSVILSDAGCEDESKSSI